MRPDYENPLTGPAHRIELLMGNICRDGRAVKVTRISESVIQVGCTTVEIAALKRLLVMATTSNVLQEGDE